MGRSELTTDRMSLLKTLFNKDANTLSYITTNLLDYHLDFSSELASILVKQGYSPDTASKLVSLSISYYATLVNSRHYEYAGVYSEYTDLLMARINEECTIIDATFSTVKEIASVLHWKSMSIHANQSEDAGVFRTSEGRTINAWSYYLPDEWGLDKVDPNKGTANSLFPPEVLKALSSHSTDYDRVEHFRNNLLWNLLNFYSLRIIIDNEDVSSLVSESLEYLMTNEFHTASYSIAIPLYAVMMFIDSKRKDLLIFNEYIKDGMIDNIMIALDNAPIGTRIDKSYLDYFAAWCRWQKWINPSKDIHNLIYALSFRMMEGQEAAAQYFYNKLKDNTMLTAYLDELAQFKDICSKTDASTLLYYIKQRQDYVVIVKSDQDQILECDYEPRSISAMVADLNIPSASSSESDSLQHSQANTSIEVNPDYPTMLRNGRLLIDKIQDFVCKKYLYQWFDNNINNVPYISYVFFGYGRKPEGKLVFTADKKDLACFIKYLNKDKGDSVIWDYFRKYIVDIKGKPVLGINPASNIKDKYDSYKKSFPDTIKKLSGLSELPEEWRRDLK